MTWTYTPPDASGTFASARDEVRMLARDVVQSASSVTDEEIAYWLKAESGDRALAAADALYARATLVESSSRQSIAIGPFSTSLQSQESAAAFRALAAALRAGGGPGGAPPVVQSGLDDGAWDDGPVFGVGGMDFAGGLPRLWG